MLSGLFGGDPNSGYIVASYGITIFVLGLLSIYLARDLGNQWRVLRRLEKETGKQRWT